MTTLYRFRLDAAPIAWLLAIVLTALVLAAATPAAAATGRGTVTLAGVVAGETFGCSVASAGDVNGDTYADVIVGAYQSGTAGAPTGRAYIYFGGPHADERPDVVLVGEAAGDAFGVSVAGAGDVNRDGFADVIVGAYENDGRGANAGRAYVYFGGPTMDSRPDVVLTGEAAGDAFGYAVAGAGDVNQDGYADVLVGAYENSTGGAGAGRVYLYHGGPRPDAVADAVLTGEMPGDRFGISVAGAGDVNKDGFADVIVGAYHNNAGGKDAGRAYVYFGGKSLAPGADLVLTGEAAGDAFGYAVAGAGDSNGDGYADVLVGAYGNDAGGSASGRAYVFQGAASPDATPDFVMTGDGTLDNLGFAVAGCGDVDGDGFADAIIGAPYSDAGRAYVAKAVGGKTRPVAAR